MNYGLTIKEILKDAIITEDLNLSKAQAELKVRLDGTDQVQTESSKQMHQELPVHEMKRLLDQMMTYRDYLKEIVSKVGRQSPRINF